MRGKDVLAICISDIHLSHKAPIARSSEDNWYDAMRYPLEQVWQLADRLGAIVICAGDIFDDGWRPHKCPPELINFALRYLPPMYAIPGQHDLPHHRRDEIVKSAFWTLVKAGKVVLIHPEVKPIEIGQLRLHGFPWGCEIQPNTHPKNDFLLDVAVIHKLIWTNATGFQGADLDCRIEIYKKKLKGYDIAIFGDNHKGFLQDNILNVGCLIRRKADEKDYQPTVGLLHSDGTISRHKLDVSQDKWLETEQLGEFAKTTEWNDFLSELRELQDVGINFQHAVEKVMKSSQVSQEVRDVILRAMGGSE